jgi:hypothetical protein
LGLILLAALWAASPPFSHSLHLRLKLDCVTCHAKAAASARVEDNLLPDQSACVKCHKQVAIRAPRRSFVSQFSHQTHLKLGNIAPVLRTAVLKKTYLGAGRPHTDAKNACQACHGEGQPAMMADCLVCHSKIDPPESCYYCHAKDAALKPATHTPDFVDVHSGPSIKKEGCAVCHGRRFRCLGCH